MLFELFLGKLGGLVLSKVVEPIWSKVVDKTTDKALDGLNNYNEFEFTLKTLHKILNSLSAKASDVEEGIKIGERSSRKKRKREVEEWLGEVKLFEKEVDELGGSQVEAEGFIKRLMDGGKAAQLDKQVKELVEQSHNFGELVLDVCGTSGDKFLTDGMVGEAFSENLERIMELLEKREGSSIGIHGMGGVGKTTLAKHVNNRLLQQAEGRVLWVTVSQEFTLRILQDKLAHLLGVNLSEKDEEDVRATRLHDALSQEKNSVLILDDVWEYIEMKKVGCTFSTECCRLIVTTRSLEVCHRLCCQRVIQVEKLREQEAWKLFSETLGDEIELSPQVEGVAKSVAKMCDGLPLGIITVAGSMRGEKAIHSWKNALTELEESVVGQDGMGDIKVFKVLKYSFNRLKRNDERESNGLNMIQHCFLNCSLYPEDYAIVREDLVKKFISDGLVDGGRSRRAQVEKGLSILDKLVSLCLLESCVDYYDGKKCVKMHDLVRSMALSICKGKYLVRPGEEILDEEEWTEDLEKVSLMQCGIKRIGEGFSPDCPKLSTLLLSGNYWLEVIPESFFSKMQGLCTLDLSWNTHISMLPDSISDLTCLKSLLLEDCRELEKVPYLGKMKALRELNLSSTGIKEAPQGLEELLNLRFLSMNADGLKMLPRGVLLKLVHLEHLNIPFHIQVEIVEIENLKRLEELSGGVKSVSDFNKFVRSRSHDPCYIIRVSKKYARPPIFERVPNWRWANNKELDLHECDLKDEKVLGKGVVYLTIRRCEGVSKWLLDDLWERFDNPTSLKRLEIQSCGGIEWIVRSDGQCSEISSLEEIQLEGLDDLKGVVGVVERERRGIGIAVVAAAAQPPVFSSLKSLLIDRCNKMRKLGLPSVLALPNLEEIDIRNCEEVEEIFEEAKEDEGRDSATTLPKLRVLKLTGLPRLRKVGLPATSGVPNLQEICIGSCGDIQEIFEDEDGGRAADSIVTLPRLVVLRLNDLARLKRVSKATIISNSIRTIWIKKCPELMKKLPLGFDDPVPPPSLLILNVEREWWESLEWDNPLLPQLLHPCLPFGGGSSRLLLTDLP